MILILAFVLTAHGAGFLPYQRAANEKALALFQLAVEAKGVTLAIESDPARTSETASAHWDTPGSMRVTFAAGFLTSPRLTPDAYRLALCHELGHLFGGAPRRPPPPEWDGPVHKDGAMLLSNEGQADYFSTYVCFRRITQSEDHQRELNGQAVPERLVRSCRKAWGATPEALGCQRAGLAGLQFLQLTREFPISFSTKDSHLSSRMEHGYPSRQCRLDTILAGAVCRQESPLVLDETDGVKNGCLLGSGARPACWYRP